MQTTPTITVTLTNAQAWAFAEFLKRVGLVEFAALAIDQEEALAMLSAAAAIRLELAQVGYAPR